LTSPHLLNISVCGCGAVCDFSVYCVGISHKRNFSGQECMGPIQALKKFWLNAAWYFPVELYKEVCLC